MKEQTNSSEVARLRQQIEQEIAAMHLALDGYAETAKHEIITRRLATLGDTLESLALQVGKAVAVELLGEALERGL